jgi:hypothetical protein
VARSSTEAEYRAMAMAATELYWIRMLLRDLHLHLPVPPSIRCDNLGAMALASNPVYHARTKHIEVDYHFIREKVLNKDITLGFISTCDQPTNIFTKGLTSSRFQLLHDKLMVCSPPIRLRRDVNHCTTDHEIPSKDADNQACTNTIADHGKPSMHGETSSIKHQSCNQTILSKIS